MAGTTVQEQELPSYPSGDTAADHMARALDAALEEGMSPVQFMLATTEAYVSKATSLVIEATRTGSSPSSAPTWSAWSPMPPTFGCRISRRRRRRLVLWLFYRSARRHRASLNMTVTVQVFPPARTDRRTHLLANVAPDVPARVAAIAGALVATIHLAPTKDDGTPGVLDGPVEWTYDATLATLQYADDDHLIVDVVSTGVAGVGTFLAHADGDLGVGVNALEQSAVIEFVAGQTTHLNMTVQVDVAPAEPTPA